FLAAFAGAFLAAFLAAFFAGFFAADFSVFFFLRAGAAFFLLDFFFAFDFFAMIDPPDRAANKENLIGPMGTGFTHNTSEPPSSSRLHPGAVPSAARAPEARAGMVRR